VASPLNGRTRAAYAGRFSENQRNRSPSSLRGSTEDLSHIELHLAPNPSVSKFRPSVMTIYVDSPFRRLCISSPDDDTVATTISLRHGSPVRSKRLQFQRSGCQSIAVAASGISPFNTGAAPARRSLKLASHRGSFGGEKTFRRSNAADSTTASRLANDAFTPHRDYRSGRATVSSTARSERPGRARTAVGTREPAHPTDSTRLNGDGTDSNVRPEMPNCTSANSEIYARHKTVRRPYRSTTELQLRIMGLDDRGPAAVCPERGERAPPRPRSDAPRRRARLPPQRLAPPSSVDSAVPSYLTAMSD